MQRGCDSITHQGLEALGTHQHRKGRCGCAAGGEPASHAARALRRSVAPTPPLRASTTKLTREQDVEEVDVENAVVSGASEKIDDALWKQAVAVADETDLKEELHLLNRALLAAVDYVAAVVLAAEAASLEMVAKSHPHLQMPWGCCTSESLLLSSCRRCLWADVEGEESGSIF